MINNFRSVKSSVRYESSLKERFARQKRESISDRSKSSLEQKSKQKYSKPHFASQKLSEFRKGRLAATDEPNLDKYLAISFRNDDGSPIYSILTMDNKDSEAVIK